MKIGVFADKGMGRWFAQLFDDMEEVTFYLAENNKHGLDVTQHKKHILTKKNNILKCLKKPIQCFNRLKENKFDNRLDFHYLELEEIIKNNQIDVAVTKSERSLYTLSCLKKKYNNFKIVYRLTRTKPFATLFDKRSFFIRESSYNQIDHFMTTSKKAKDTLLLEGIGENRITHIYSGVDCNFFKPRDINTSRKKFDIPSDRFQILFVGKLNSLKGPFTLLYATKLLKERIPNIHIVFLGRGGQKDNLIAMSKLLGISDNVSIGGWVDNQKINEYYNSSNLFVLPSLHTVSWTEQFAFAGIEAMASGVPCIFSKVGAMKEAVHDDENLLFSTGDYGELSDKIFNLYSNPELMNKYQTGLRNLAEEKYNSLINGPIFHQLILDVYRN